MSHDTPNWRKKPVTIHAFCLGIDNMPDWFCDLRSAGKVRTYGEWKHLTHCEIDTLEGVMRGERGDYIIKGVKGEVYPCKPDIFAATYEPADAPQSETPTTIPEGWRLVPAEPDNVMVKAGAIEIHGESGRLGAGWGFAAQVYRAMLSAAPKATK